MTSLGPAWPERAAWGTAPSLRAWQSTALTDYLARNPRDFLAVATPGAGKTTFALTVAAELLGRRVVDRLVIVAPTEHLKLQWAEAAARAGIPIDPTYSAGSGKIASDYVGVAVTYAGVGVNPLAGNELAIEMLKQSDLVIDLVFLLHSKEQVEIQAAGARMLLVMEPPETLARLFPTADQRRRVETSEELLAAATTLRVTSPAGTDVTYRLGAYPIMTQYGYTDTPGRWDHWPSTFLFTNGHDDDLVLGVAKLGAIGEGISEGAMCHGRHNLAEGPSALEGERDNDTGDAPDPRR